MEAEQNGGRARNKLIAKRDDFSAVVSPQTFQKFKSMKRVMDNGSKQADSQTSNANGSTQQNTDNKPCPVLKVTAEEYDQIRKKYTKNKKILKQKPAEQQFLRAKSKSPSSLKVSAEDTNNKREKSTSPRNSGVGVKQNEKTKISEKTSPASRNNLKPENKPVSRRSSPASTTNLKPENKPVSRRSYDVADTKNKSVTGDGSKRRSAGMVNSKNVDNGQSLEKGNQVASNRESSSRLGESSRVNMLDNTQEKKGHQKASLIPKSPNNLKKNNTKKRKSIEKVNKNKTPECPTSKDYNPSDKENTKGKNGECSNNNRYANNPDKKLESDSSEYEMDVELITNKIKQIKIADVAKNNQDLSNELGDTQKNSTKKTEGDSNVSEGNKNIMSNDCLKKCSDSKLDKTVGPMSCEDKNKTPPINEKILSGNNEDQLMIEVTEKFGIKVKVVDFPFVTKRMDESLATDILQPTIDLDCCLQDNLNKCDAPPLEKDSNDNNFSTKYQAVPGTSKSIEINLDQGNLQASLSTVATKLAKKTTTARKPVMLKTPKRLKDGETMSEMLIYKLGSHSTPRKIRKNRDLDSFRKSDWGTPVTDRITPTFLKRKISKKIKGKIFIKKTSQGTLQPLPLSKLVPKNSPRKDSPRKSTHAESGDETYKVVPVSDLIKKFENLEKVEESPAHTLSKVPVTFKKNTIFEKWQNSAKNIQLGLKEVKNKLSDLDVQVDKETNKTSMKVPEPKSNISEQEPTITSTNTTDNNENFNSLTILNTDCIDNMSFVSLKFDKIYSDECADQTGKNMRFSDLYKEINFQLTDSEKNEAGETKNDGSPEVKVDDLVENNSKSVAISDLQINNNNDPSSGDKTSNNQGQGKGIEEGTDVLETLEHCKGEEKIDVSANQSNNDQTMDGLAYSNTPIISNNKQGQGKLIEEEGTDVLENLDEKNYSAENKGEEPAVSGKPDRQSINYEDGFRGFEDVIVAEGRIDTTGEDRASPAYEAGDDVIKDEDFGESYRQKLLSMSNSQEEDEDDASISTLLALSRQISKQPTSYADYRKQFMAVKSRSLPPQKINRCDDDDPKMSL